MDKKQVLQKYMEWVDQVSEDLEDKSSFSPEEIVSKIYDIIKEDGVKVEIWNVNVYGYREIAFKKTFILPHPPTIGMSILEQTDDCGRGHTFTLSNHEYEDTSITYRVLDDTYEVNIRHNWRFNRKSFDRVNEVINQHHDFDWELMTHHNEVSEMLEWVEQNQHPDAFE